MIIDPLMIHFPKWQRAKLDVNHAMRIGKEFDEGKWDPVKLYQDDEGKLICIDGDHRTFGRAIYGDGSKIVSEFLTIPQTQAIYLFLTQGATRFQLKPADYIAGSILVGEKEYVDFANICHVHNITFDGDDGTLVNPQGKTTAITDAVRICQKNPELWDRILSLIGKLSWAGNDSNVYASSMIRVLRALYAKYQGHEKEMEKALLSSCAGSEWYHNMMKPLNQRQRFDYLNDVVEQHAALVYLNNQKRQEKKEKMTA